MNNLAPLYIYAKVINQIIILAEYDRRFLLYTL